MTRRSIDGRCTLNTKPNKEIDRAIEKKYASKRDNCVLFAYSDIPYKNRPLSKQNMPEWAYFVSCTKKRWGKLNLNAIELRSYDNSGYYTCVTFYKKEGIDCITQMLHYIEKYSAKNVNLASWVIKYALEKYDAKCPMQLDNIMQQGDSESLFAGEGACERLEKIVKDTD